MIVGPAYMAKQSMEAILKFYHNFYSFTYIAADPPEASYTFAPEFADLGIFGGENGGAPANLSRVNLTAEWGAIIDSLPTEGTVPAWQWIPPANGAFISLRDCHPSVWSNKEGESMAPVKLLNEIFYLALMDLKGGPVALQVTGAGNATIDSPAEPVVTDKTGNVVKSIEGDPPMQWLLENIVQSPTIPDLCTKSVGGRMNKLFQSMKGGSLAFMLGAVGPLSGINQGNISVELEGEDGSPISDTWAWQIGVAKELPFGCFDLACVVDAAPSALNISGDYREKVKIPNNALSGDWSADALSVELISPKPVPPRKPPSLLSADQPAGAGSLPDEVFAWLLDPSCTFGYMAFRQRPDGTEFGVFKYTMFTLGSGLCGNITYEDPFKVAPLKKETFQKFAEEAQNRGVDRLIVDFTGNGGGTTLYAWQFVQMMLPEVPYSHTCGSVNRPIPNAYNLWQKINLLPIEQFLGDAVGPGFRQERANVLKANPDVAKAVYSNTMLILSAIDSFGLANVTDILDELGSGYTEESGMHVLEKFTALYEEGTCANPFAGNSFGGKTDSFDQYLRAYQHPELEDRGGHLRNFTARIYECAQEPPGDLINPFTDIILVSDGTCGSSCYLAGGTTWAAAKAYSNRSVRFATYGGIGGSLADARKTLSPTAFPGGNVETAGDIMIDGIFSCLLVQMGLAGIIGNSQLFGSLAEVWNEMTSMVPAYAHNMPAFVQSEVFQNAFGPNTPPGEYIFTPTDMYMPEWFTGVSGTNAYKWDISQLEAMHQMAAQGFK